MKAVGESTRLVLGSTDETSCREHLVHAPYSDSDASVSAACINSTVLLLFVCRSAVHKFTVAAFNRLLARLGEVCVCKSTCVLCVEQCASTTTSPILNVALATS